MRKLNLFSDGGRSLGLLALLMPTLAAAQDRADALVQEYATCAAYYFNAVNAKPMKEYEDLYSAGERAFNEALLLRDRLAVDDLVANASAVMTEMTGQNWLNFHRVDAKYAAPCAQLLSEDNAPAP